MAKSALLSAAMAAILLSPISVVAAHSLRHSNHNNIESVVDALSHNSQEGKGGGDPCHHQTNALRLCISSSGDDSTVECAHCMINGLDFTKPLTCNELKTDSYCPGVAECVAMKCKHDCLIEYYAGLNCAIRQSCKDVRCEHQDSGQAVTTVASVNAKVGGAKLTSKTSRVNVGEEMKNKSGKSSKDSDDDSNHDRSGGESTNSKNVYGDPLKPCSQPGMAKTGYDRSGQCVDQEGDTGSHHICINLSSTSSKGKDFCEVTGQVKDGVDWCQDSMPCHEDDSKTCPVQRWCVCQWAFEGYLEKAGGCDSIQEIECEAVNIKAKEAYEGDVEKHGAALDCLKKKCNLTKEKGVLVEIQ